MPDLAKRNKKRLHIKIWDILANLGTVGEMMEKTAGQYHKELKMNSFDIVKAIICSSSAWENRARIEWSEADEASIAKRQVIAWCHGSVASKCANNARLEQKLSTISPQNKVGPKVVVISVFFALAVASPGMQILRPSSDKLNQNSG